MRKSIYYLLAKIFYIIAKPGNMAFEYFLYKAEAIAEAEYNRDVMKFYEG